jgi:LDH2 family malate/lactate/ureidoglycolate dehydrogenase
LGVAHDFDDLARFGAELLAGAGLEAGKSQSVARLLVTADAMGHSTHGLAQLADYLADLESGAMAKGGEPTVVSDRGAAIVWDGQRLPGVWLTAKALDLAAERAAIHGLCAVSIRRSHHIGCLAAFLPAATERGLMAIVASSDPSATMVAPFGGRRGVLTPNPIAVGIPTEGDPILIDTSTSITTAGYSARLREGGARFPGLWAIDAEGRATDDPGVLTDAAGGALLPAGGLDHGWKGYGLALMVEALTQGLSAYGRADGEAEWGASVFVQVIDPALFGGAEGFARQTGFLAEACRASPPIDPAAPVRAPGEAALVGLRRANERGVDLHPAILPGLSAAAERYAVAAPKTVGGDA